MTSKEAPRSPLAADVAGLIGLLAVLEGDVMIIPDSDALPDWATHVA